MSRFEDYKDRFRNIRMERQDGVLEVTLHREGGQAVFDVAEGGMHDQIGQAFYQIGRDPETRVVVLTHEGDELFSTMETGSERPTPQFWDRMLKEGKDQILNILDVDVPIVAALKGNAFIHAEVIALSDIVVAAEGARLADKAHTCIGIPPSDGVHVIWTMLLGPNRGRHFLLTGAEIDAAEAQRLGVVAEVTPRDQVLDRARVIARELAQKPRLTLRYARLALTQDLKRRLVNDLGYGLALEGLGVLGMMTER